MANAIKASIALNGRDIVIDYIKHENKNVDNEIVRSQYISKKAKKAMSTMREQGQRLVCVREKLGFNDFSEEAQLLPYDDTTFKGAFKDAVYGLILKLPQGSLNWGKIVIATVFCSDCSKIALERDCPDSVLAIVTTMWEIFSDLSQNILDMGDWSGFTSFYDNLPNQTRCSCKSDSGGLLGSMIYSIPAALISTAWIVCEWMLDKSATVTAKAALSDT